MKNINIQDKSQEVKDGVLIQEISNHYPHGSTVEVEKISALVAGLQDEHGMKTITAGYVLRCKGAESKFPVGGKEVLRRPTFWVAGIRLGNIGYPGNGWHWCKPTLMQRESIQLVKEWYSKNGFTVVTP